MPQRRKRRQRKHKPSDLVLIALDCRANPTATGEIAVYEGIYAYKTNRRFRNSRAGTAKTMVAHAALPRLRLQDGSYLWGNECWWTTVKDLRRVYTQRGNVDLLRELNLKVVSFQGHDSSLDELLRHLEDDH